MLSRLAIAAIAVTALGGVAPIDMTPDGPYSDLDAPVIEVSSFDDILALSELDGDPATHTEDEARMALILMQVLLADPTAALDPVAQPDNRLTELGL